MNALVIFRMDMDIVESVQSGDSSPCLTGRILLKVLLIGLVLNFFFPSLWQITMSVRFVVVGPAAS